MGESVQVATIVKLYGNRAWIEYGFSGDASVFVQSDAPDSKAVKVCTVYYDYLFADNRTRRRLATMIASQYVSGPIEERVAEMPGFVAPDTGGSE